MIALRRGQGMEAAADALRGGAGQAREDALQAGVLQLQLEERRLLELRSNDARRRLGQVRSVLVVGTLLGLLIAAAAAGACNAAMPDAGRQKRRCGTAKNNTGCSLTACRTTPSSCSTRRAGW